MAAPAVLKIDIIADATKAGQALNQTGDAATSTKSKLGGLATALGGAFAVTQVVQFGAASVRAAQESEVATNRLQQVFKSMGDTTGEAAAQAEKYASALSRKIGVDDEAILAAQAQLATFSAVSNETARGAGIFDRATAAAADLAATGFGTLDTNSVQLGKALQDPVKGITALSRSGVTFSEDQKAMISSLVETGDLLGAQEIVLKAVEQQVGGTAEATATSGDKMSVAFGEVQESIGRALLPALEAIAPVLAKIAGFIERNISWILPLAAAFGIWAAATWILTGATTAFGLSLGLAVGWIALIIVAIAAIIAAIVWAYNNVDWFRTAVDAMWQAVVAAFNFVKEAAIAVFGWIRDNWPLLLPLLLGPFGIALALIIKNWDTIKAAAQVLFSFISTIFGAIGNAIMAAAGFIGSAIGRIIAIWQGLKDAATSVYNWIKEKFDAIWNTITGVANGIGDVIGRITSGVKSGLNVLIRAWNGLEFTIPRIEIDLPGPLGSVGAGPWTIGLPNIPLLASGGLVTQTGLAIVHAGERYSGVGGNGWGNTTINVNVTTTGLGADAPQIQRAVANALRGYTSRNGPLDIPVRQAV